MTTDDTDDESGHGRAGALEAILEVAQQQDLANDFPIASSAFEDADYEEIIAIAWRHQFSTDRTRFKREIRELEQHVSPKILARLQAFE